MSVIAVIRNDITDNRAKVCLGGSLTRMVKNNRKQRKTSRRNCIQCRKMYDVYSHSDSVCWECITLSRERNMVEKQECRHKKIGKNLCGDAQCLICYRLSFNSHYRSLCWSSENSKTPREVSKMSNKKYQFDCECGHVFSSCLCTIANNIWCPYCGPHCRKLCERDDCSLCYNNSFAASPRAKYWNVELNNGVKPREVALTANKKFWFDCLCGHSFLMCLGNISADQWCPYCSSSKKLCDNEDCEQCFRNSFASVPQSQYWSYERNGDVKPRNVTKCSDKKYWFNCVCGHEFSSQLGNIVHGQWCAYCCFPCKKLCENETCDMCFSNSFASVSQSQHWSHELNNGVTPRTIAIKTNKKYWFDCPKCKISFKMCIYSVTKGCWCQNCTKKTERKLHTFLNTLFTVHDVVREMRFEWCVNDNTGHKLPFDFYIKSLKLLIELDGDQHFRQVWNWKTPKEHQERDIYKMKCAIDNEMTIVRLLQEDVLYDRYDWKSALTSLLVKHSTPQIHLLDNGTGVYKLAGYDRILESATQSCLTTFSDFLHQDLVCHLTKSFYGLMEHLSAKTNVPVQRYLELVREYSKTVMRV